MSESTGTEIAIIGMAGRFPGAPDIEALWRNVCAGVESVRTLTDEEMIGAGVDPSEVRQPGYVKRGAVLDGVEMFDADFFGVTPREAELMDPQQRLFLETAWEALEHAGYDADRSGGPVGVFAGGKMGTYIFQLMSNPELVRSLDTVSLGLGNDIGLLAMRASHKLNLRGPSYFVQSACSTSLVAVHLACQSLLIDECRLALAGGVAIDVPHRRGYVHTESGILAPDGHVRTFDASAQGTVFGSGVGVVVLKRLEDALADRDRIWAVIKGSATNNDGAAKPNFTAPSVEGQSEVVLRALIQAEVDPETIGYVEAHGTATQLGDPVEVRALTRAWRAAGARRKQICALGSVKSNLGHLDAAAGVTGLIKTALALDRKKLPPVVGFERPNPKIDFAATPFRVQTELADWPAGEAPRRAGLSSFGFGGTNAHMILEEAPPPSPDTPADAGEPWQLLVLSARTETALEAQAGRLAAHLQDADLADIAFTLSLGRKVLPWRRIVVARDREEAAARLAAGETGWVEDGAPPVAFLFSGQGSQYAGMGRGLYETEPVYRAAIDRCAGLLGRDLRELEDVDRTDLAQPALFAVEYALAELWEAWGVRPQALLGHSLGEYVAACRAGVFSLEDALALVATRGRLMASMPPGAMLAVSLPEAELLPLLDAELSLAAVNGPARCVVSGPEEGMARLAARLEAEGVRCRRLHTSHAFHSPMMDPVLPAFRDEVARVSRNAPEIPFLSNLTGTWITAEQAVDPGYWAEHLRRTVRFGDALAELWSESGRLLLEAGPGITLATLANEHPARGDAGAALASLRHPDDRREDRPYLLTALGRLFLAGVPVDWEGFWGEERRRRVPLPSYPFERKRFWIKSGIDRGQGLAAAGPQRLRKEPDLARWFYTPSWKPSPPPPPADLSEPARWLVFSAGEVGKAVVARLEAAGQEVFAVEAGEGLDSAEAYRALLRKTGAPGTIVHLWSLGGEGFREAQERGTYSLLFLAQALAAEEMRETVRLLVVSAGLHDVSGAEPFVPEKAPLLGPCLVIPQEHQNVILRSIDVDPSGEADRLAGRLLAEAASLGTETAALDLVVAWRGSRRLAQSYERAPLPPRGVEESRAARRLRNGGAYLITGGLGSVGLLLAEGLARGFHARLALVGRSAFPERGEWEGWLAAHPASDPTARKIRRLLEIEEAGGKVVVLRADVTDERQLAAALDRAEARFGRLDGVIHLAGVLKGESIYRPLTEIGRAACEEQWSPKVHGLWALEQAVAGRDLDFCLLFSSNAAVLGGLGFVAYAAANLYADAFARERSRRGGPAWISADWDEWPAQALELERPIQTSMTEFAMTAEEGLEALRRVVAFGDGQVVVSTGDLDARLDLWVRRSPVRSAAPGTRHARPELRTAYTAPRDDAERAVAEIWQELLGLERVGIADNFFDLGGHSLLATQVLSRLRAVLGAEVPLQALFEDPTVAGLARAARTREAAPEALGEGQIPHRAPSQHAPLSFGQERMWFLEQLDRGTAAYHLLSAVRLTGRLDTVVLERALREVFRRHEALRTTFPLGDDGHPIQAIAPEAELSLPVVDLSGLPEAEREVRMRRLATAEHERTFDLTRGPLLRVTVLRLGPEDHALLQVMHHIISDGWSMGVLIREAAQVYQALREEKPLSLPELPIQFADYAVWQRGWLQGEVLEEHLAWWRAQLAGDLPPLELPTDRPRASTEAFRAAVAIRALPERTGSDLRALGRRAGATPFMILLAAFEALLSRWSGSAAFLVGSPIAGRNRAEVEGLIGFFLNTLVLRAEPRGDQGFLALLERVAASALGAYAHQDLPLETVLHTLSGDRSARTSPFRVMFLLQNYPFPELDLPGLSFRPVQTDYRVDLGASLFDLGLMVEERDGRWVAEVTYNAALFERETIDCLLGWYESLLIAAADDPERPLADLPLASAGEMERIAAWSRGPEAAAAVSVPQQIRALAESRPDAPAVVDSTGLGLTYAELVSRAGCLAAHLRRLGVGPESLVPVCLDRSPEQIVAILGVLQAGGAWVPLDPSIPRERLAGLLEDLGHADRQAPLLARRSLAGHLPASARRTVWLDDLDLAQGAPLAESPVAAEPPAYVIYTSGSTGRPKGVMVSHGALAVFTAAAAELYGLGPSDRVLQLASPAFDASIEEIWPCLASGGTVVLRDEEMIATAAGFLARCRDLRLTVLDLPTAFWHELTLGMEREGLSLPESVRCVILGGERALPERAALWWRQTGTAGARLFNTYGPTEATVVATAAALDPATEDGRRGLPIGRPLRGVEAWVVEPGLRLAPVGLPGELLLGGEALARGYLGRPDLTAEGFVPKPEWARTDSTDRTDLTDYRSDRSDPSGPSDARLYRTGDLARWRPDGTLEFLGRIDHQVKIRGFRVEPGEIETVLRRHPAVREAVVAAREDGPGGLRLIAWYTAEPALDPAPPELRAFLQANLPDSMIPAAFVRLDALPLTPGGKVDRRALPAPEHDRAGRSYEAPRNEAEEVLAALFAEVLGVDRIGVVDDFFELGGHSLLLPQVLHRIREAFDVEVPLRSLYEEPTVAGLALIVEDLILQEIETLEEGRVAVSASPAARALVPVDPAGTQPPFFCVHPAGGDVLCFTPLARHLGPDQPFYGLQSPGLAIDCEPFASLPEMAAGYLAEIRQVQPMGPYRIGGWSLGGVVAFEMAQQLARAGQEVELLAIFDTVPRLAGTQPAAAEPGFWDDDARWLLDIAVYAEGLWGKSLGLTYEELAALGPDERLALCAGRLRELQLLPAGAGAAWLARVLRVFKANVQAGLGYEPVPYPGRITLFRAADAPEGDLDLGWRGYSPLPVEVHLCPGNHVTLLAEAHVAALAERLRGCLMSATEEPVRSG